MIRDVVARARARVAPTIWQRRWAVVWNAGGDLRTDAEWLAYHLPRFGFEVVCVKVCDGSHRYAGSHSLNLADEWLAPLRRAGLRLTGWGYCYGYDPAAEAVLAAQLAHELGLRAFVADCEREFEYDPVDEPERGAGVDRYARSSEWLRAWRAIKGAPPLGLTSFGRVDLHRVDFAAWARAGARFVPQAYANASVELDVPACVEHAATYFDRRRVHPWVGLYHSDTGDMTGAGYVAQLHAARTRGFGVYLADTAQVDDLHALSAAR